MISEVFFMNEVLLFISYPSRSFVGGMMMQYYLQVVPTLYQYVDQVSYSIY